MTECAEFDFPQKGERTMKAKRANRDWVPRYSGDANAGEICISRNDRRRPWPQSKRRKQNGRNDRKARDRLQSA